MCLWSVADVFLEDPPKQKEEKKEEKKEKKDAVLVSDQLSLQPIVSEQHLPVFSPSAHKLPHTTPHHSSSTSSPCLDLKTTVYIIPNELRKMEFNMRQHFRYGEAPAQPQPLEPDRWTDLKPVQPAQPGAPSTPLTPHYAAWSPVMFLAVPPFVTSRFHPFS